MAKSTTKRPRCRFSTRASLIGLGVEFCRRQVWAPIKAKVQIRQKTLLHTPVDKLQDSFIGMLAGAQGLVETNKRVRPDRALQAAFNRQGCAEQSTISETLNACTAGNVAQLEEAVKLIYRQHSAGYCHNYQEQFQLLDADTSGMPAGKKAELSTKGYFPRQRNRRGRQLARVVASWYDEVVVDQLYAGTVQLTKALQSLILAAEDVLELDEAKRRRTIWRIDAGGGSDDDVNWVLARGYHLLVKDYSTKRATGLAKSIQTWYPDTKIPGREVGLVTQPHPYVRPTVQIAARSRKKNGQWSYAVLICTLSPQEILALMGQPAELAEDQASVLRAYVHYYDKRGGGVETQVKGDRQGLGLSKRNKKKFAAQQVLVLLGSLAHNVTIWARNWLAQTSHKLREFGILRLVRDAFQIRGCIVLRRGQIREITLDKKDPLAGLVGPALKALLMPVNVAINLGEI